MKKLIIPAFAFISFFTSCTTVEIDTKPDKNGVETTTVSTLINDTKGLNSSTGKFTTNSAPPPPVTVSNQLQNIHFEFKSLSLDYQTDKTFPNETNDMAFSIEDVAIGSNKVTVTAQTAENGEDGKQRNEFVATYPQQSIKTITDFKNVLDTELSKPYIEYRTTQNEFIIANQSNPINIDLKPVTGRISTAFRLSDNDLSTGIYYTIDAYNSGLDTIVESGNIDGDLISIYEASGIESIASDGNSITYTIRLYQFGNLLSEYIVTEPFLTGKAVTTLYKIDENKIYKQSVTVNLNVLPLDRIEAEKPLD